MNKTISTNLLNRNPLDESALGRFHYTYEREAALPQARQSRGQRQSYAD